MHTRYEWNALDFIDETLKFDFRNIFLKVLITANVVISEMNHTSDVSTVKGLTLQLNSRLV